LHIVVSNYGVEQIGNKAKNKEKEDKCYHELGVEFFSMDLDIA